MMYARTYDLTNLEKKINTNRYMRWHTMFSRNVTSVLDENEVNVPVENSFQPNPSTNHADQKFKAIHPTHIDTSSMHLVCYYPHHRPSDGIASQDGISQLVVLFPGTPNMCA